MITTMILQFYSKSTQIILLIEAILAICICPIKCSQMGNSHDEAKKALAEVLHYAGLEDVHESAVIPEYVEKVFEAVDALEDTSSITQSDDRDSKEPTVWGIKLQRATRNNPHVTLHYMIQEEVLHVTIKRAEVVVPVLHGPENQPTHPQPCTIKICSRNPFLCSQQRMMTAQVITLSSSQYEVFDITSVFDQWLSSYIPRGNHQSFLTVVHVSKNAFGGTRTFNGTNDPILVLYANMDTENIGSYLTSPSNGHDGRPARSLRHHSPSPSQPEVPQLCSLVPWYVSFRDIGWDWVVQPQGYYGNRCEGRCDIAFLNKNVRLTNHAIVKTLAKDSHRINVTSQRQNMPPEVSCIPQEFSAISLIVHTRDDTVMKRQINEMNVKSCCCI